MIRETFSDNILVEKANAFVVHANTLLKVESLPSLAITDNSLVRIGKTHLVVKETKLRP